jgi:iron complex outermembrane receptor protein
LQAAATWNSGLYAGLAATWAKHTYDFTRSIRGEMIASGNDIDTAPRTLGSARLGWAGSWGFVELEGVHQGRYYLDAANLHKYEGHNVANTRATWLFSESWSITGRINNIGDDYVADRADFAFGEYRYLPGRGREFFVELAYQMF